jgi:hypothetical protein
MKRRLTPWLLAGATALACIAGAHVSAWGRTSGASDPSAPFTAVGRPATAEAPATLAPREFDGAGRDVLVKFGFAAAALALFAVGLWVALHRERHAALSTGRRGRVLIRGPPAPSHVF